MPLTPLQKKLLDEWNSPDGSPPETTSTTTTQATQATTTPASNEHENVLKQSCAGLFHRKATFKGADGLFESLSLEFILLRDHWTVQTALIL